MKPVQEQFDSFIEFERAWHNWVAFTFSEQDEPPLEGGFVLDEKDYFSGKFDYVPYELWDTNVTDWKTL